VMGRTSSHPIFPIWSRRSDDEAYSPFRLFRRAVRAGRAGLNLAPRDGARA